SPRYNIAPTNDVLSVRLDPESRQRICGPLHWGLIPSWADDPKIGSRMINARAETLNEKPSFRNAFKSRRCLILADGFYEWRKVGKKRLPQFISMADNQPFAFAGLWETWRGNGGPPLESCTIITTAANELTRTLHDRMPAILDQHDAETWLSPTADR